jgi:hypothetical protein
MSIDVIVTGTLYHIVKGNFITTIFLISSIINETRNNTRNLVTICSLVINRFDRLIAGLDGLEVTLENLGDQGCSSYFI